MNPEYATVFAAAINEVFSTMLNVKVSTGSATIREPGHPSLHVSAIIGMSGDVVGVAALGFPLESARQAVARFTGSPLPESHEDFADAVGELVNMVTGVAKAKLTGRSISISCPSVVIGQDHKLFQQKNRPVMEIPCQSVCGPFSVLVSIKESSPSATAAGACAAAGR